MHFLNFASSYILSINQLIQNHKHYFFEVEIAFSSCKRVVVWNSDDMSVRRKRCLVVDHMPKKRVSVCLDGARFRNRLQAGSCRMTRSLSDTNVGWKHYSNATNVVPLKSP